MKTNRFTLSFIKEDKSLEKVFLEEYRDRVSKFSLWSLILGLIFYAAFAILDAVLLPEKKYILWFIRFAIVSPVLIVFIATSPFPFFRKVAQAYIFIGIILSGAGISFMVALAPSPAASSYYAGIILVLMLGYGFTRLRFKWATLAGWINILFYEVIAIWIVQTPTVILVNNNFFFISANIIGMITCYSMEYFTRRDFYLSRLLESEQHKVIILNRDLEKKVSERTSEISLINKELENEIQARNALEFQKEKLHEQLMHTQKMESIGKLAGGIAHDFNNQLMGIQGNAEMIILKTDNDKLKQYASNICKGSQNGAKLTQQLLSFARKAQYENVLIDLNTVIDEVVGILKHTIDKKITIVINKSAEKLTLYGDFHQIQNAFLNVALNSRDAIVDRGNIKFESNCILVNEENRCQYFNISPGQYSLVKIIDDGCGMTDDIRSKVFDPFFTTKEVGKGTGMGLSAAYGTVKYHKGEIFVDSIPGKGTTFTVFFPLAITEKTLEIKSTPIVSKDRKGRILIIDDDEIIRTASSDYLTDLGYNTHCEADGESGLEYFKNNLNDLDLVIMDLIMPNRGGADIFPEMISINPKVKILIMSGNSFDDPRVTRMIEKGIPFLQKPFSLNVFSDLISDVLHRIK